MKYLNNVKNNVKKVTDKIKASRIVTMIIGALLLTPASECFAAATAEDKWNSVISFILPWISRLGGVVILIGAVEFGLAFKNDDAEGKTKGMRTVIAGCIVVAVGLSSSTFLY